MRPMLLTRNEWFWLLLALVAILFHATGALAAAPVQRHFATADDATAALVAAVKANDRKAIVAVLGDAGSDLSSGDAVADRAAKERFVASYDAKHAVRVDGDTARLTIGTDDFPFAFPLVKSAAGWHFDTAAGVDELNARRIGENELYAINVLRAIVDAQRDYAAEDRDGDGVLAYARRITSSPGKRDGLYWPTKAGEVPSPLGALVAQAAGEGYRAQEGQPIAYHGYYYRLLGSQGPNAPGGAYSYTVRGRAIAGFAVLAYPAKYGSSGIMSFIVGQDGKVFQADLGRNTRMRAAEMRRFDPGPGWTAVSAP